MNFGHSSAAPENDGKSCNLRAPWRPILDMPPKDGLVASKPRKVSSDTLDAAVGDAVDAAGAGGAVGAGGAGRELALMATRICANDELIAANLFSFDSCDLRMSSASVASSRCVNFWFFCNDVIAASVVGVGGGFDAVVVVGFPAPALFVDIVASA